MKRAVLLACLAGALIALAQAFLGLTTPAGVLIAFVVVALLVRSQVRKERAADGES